MEGQFSLLQEDAGIWTDNYPLDFDDHQSGAEDLSELLRLLDDGDSLGAEQLAADSSGVKNHAHQSDDGPSGMLYLQLAAGGDDVSLEQSPVGAVQPPPLASADDGTIQVGFDSLEPAADMLTTEEPDNEMEIAEMVRVAAQCGQDNASKVWSDQEQEELLKGLAMYAEDDLVNICFKIAFHLPKKTAPDVALRCRWLQKKRNNAEGAVLAQEDCASRNLKKVRGDKTAKINNKIYPLSKEALNFKSNKELISDNNKFLKLIEENLRTGQLANTADYFYYVKTNMDVIEERGSEFGISMDMPPIDEQGLEEILQSRLNSLALIED